jgi:hypothetical protein
MREFLHLTAYRQRRRQLIFSGQTAHVRLTDIALDTRPAHLMQFRCYSVVHPDRCQPASLQQKPTNRRAHFFCTPGRRGVGQWHRERRLIIIPSRCEYKLRLPELHAKKDWAAPRCLLAGLTSGDCYLIRFHTFARNWDDLPKGTEIYGTDVHHG